MAESQAAIDSAKEEGTTEHFWKDFFEQTKAVVQGYGPILVYYVKAYKTADWKNLVGEDTATWSPTDVLEHFQKQKNVLEAVGAHERIFATAEELKKMIEDEPEAHEGRLRFLSAANEFVQRLPFVDVFPLNLEEKPNDRHVEMRKICGIFYSLQFQLDMPLRWFHYYAEQFRKNGQGRADVKAVPWSRILEKAFGEHKNPLDTDSEEDEFFVRHVLSEEALETVVDSIKRKRSRALEESEHTEESSVQ